MPKLQIVTLEELKAAEDAAFEVSQTIAGLLRRVDYMGEIEKPLGFASSFLSMSRTAADLAAHFIVQSKMQEMTREIEALHAAKTA
jgi:hypothetical protein